MVAIQRIWMLCLLVIAGSGPLPLWLHQIVCHGHNSCHSHGHCHHGHSHAGQSNAGQSNAGHSHAAGSQRQCTHDHSLSPLAKRAKAFPQWQSSPDSHDDCAVCFTLSQLTTAPSLSDPRVCNLFSQGMGQLADSQVCLQTVSAYSSRGPPTV